MKTTVLRGYVVVMLLIITCVCGSNPVAAQQKPMFSQYMFNMLNINPAYAGNRNVLSVAALYRNQWVGIEGAPKTGSLSIDNRRENSNVGIGMQFYDDQIGIERTSGINGFYAYHIPSDNATLSLGINGGILNYTANFTRVSTIQPGDPSFAKNINGWLPTFGAGLLYSREKWYVGLSVPDMLKTKINEAGQADVSSTAPFLHFFATGGVIIKASEQVSFKPSFLVKAVGGAPVQLDANANVWFSNIFSLGVSYRTGDAIVGMAELQASPQIRIGYGYDHTISGLSAYAKGTHELMLRFEFGSSKKGGEQALSPRYY
jgi:type IX secretion system PorP/SprF family membrane protein